MCCLPTLPADPSEAYPNAKPSGVALSRSTKAHEADSRFLRPEKLPEAGIHDLVARERWQGVRTSEFELQQLELLRRELGIPHATQALQKESSARAA